MSAGPVAAFEAAEVGGPRRLQVIEATAVMLKGRGTETEPVLQLSLGAVLSNMGCDAGWCEVRPFRGGPSGFVTERSLVPAAGPDGTVPMGRETSRERARTGDFDATTEVACAQEAGEALGVCIAQVARDTGGDATVVVTFGNGFRRSLYFAHGEFISASTTMSGAGRDIDWRLDDDLHVIRVDDQRFRLPAVFVFGP
jgi:hypothetical protein